MNEYPSILSLVEDSPEFTTLHEHFTKFNPFKVLQIDQYEIRHSNMIAWLLEAQGNHQLGDYVFKKLMAKVLLHEENQQIIGTGLDFEAQDLLKHNFYDLQVIREKVTDDRKRIDLFALSEAAKVVVIIENKYYASESEAQLSNYLTDIRKNFSGYKVIPLFLTLNEVTATHEEYLKLGYKDLLLIIEELLRAKEATLQKEIYDFICHYKELLADQLLENEELAELARRIYENHFKAIATLKENQLKDGLQSVYKEYKEAIDYVSRVGGSITKLAFQVWVNRTDLPIAESKDHFSQPSFILKSWDENLRHLQLSRNWWLNNGLIAYFEKAGEQRIKIKVEVGPLEFEDRKKLLESLQKESIAIRPSAYNESTRTTRIYMDFAPVTSWEDRFDLTQRMKELTESKEFKEFLVNVDRAVSKLYVSNQLEKKGIL